MLQVKSIKRFLIVGITSCLTFVWLISAVLIFQISQEEVEELFDAELAQMARILQSVINASHTKRTQLDALPYFDDDVLNEAFGDNEYTKRGHKYEQKLAFQMWDESGKLFFENHVGLPKSNRSLSEGFNSIEHKGYVWRTFTIKDRNNSFWIRTSQREDVRSELTNQIALDTIIPNLFVLPILFLMLGWVINKGLSPLSIISQALKDRGHNNLNHIAQSSYPDELKVLLIELNNLFSRVTHAHERERRFTADAAHELRTPLAISKVHLQNIQETTKESNTRDFVGKALTGIERLIHMVQQLLILSRLDSNQKEMEQIPVIVEDLVNELCSDLKQLPELATDTIIVSSDSSPTWIFDEAQLRILLRNLLDNAARYGFENSIVQVNINKHSIEIINQCPKLDQEHLEHITERFVRGTSNKQGSGLGLSICQQICELNDLTMNMQPRTDDSTGIITVVSGFS